MLVKVLIACLLMALTVFLHALGFSALLRAMMRWHVLARSGFMTAVRMVVGLTCWLILVHLVEISVWGLFYFLQGCMPNAKTAFYFSAVTYTTLGDASLVLPEPWRMFAPLEALTAMLMCGLSTGLFFAIVSQWISNWTQRRAASEPHAAEPQNK